MKICLLTLLSFVLLLSIFSVGNVFAQGSEERTEDLVELKLNESSGREVDIQVDYHLVSNVSSYDLKISYPSYLVYKGFSEGTINCSPEVITVEDNHLSLSCYLSPYQTLTKDGSIAKLNFEISGSGNEQITFSEASFGGLEVNSEGLYVSSELSGNNYVFSNLTVEDAITWLGVVCLIGLGMALYIHFTHRGKGRNDQIVFASLIAVIAISGLGAITLALNAGNYDLREEAALLSCETSCSDRECGPDGCGGYCGICDGSGECSEDGLCEYDKESDENDRYDYCEADNECVIVSMGCCPCYAGGSERAINVDKVEEYNTLLNCGNITCPDVYSCTDSKAVCQRNRCRLINDNVLGASTEGNKLVDLNNDGMVTIYDYAIFLSDYQNWQYNGYLEGRSDLNEDQEISTFDYLIFMEEYFEK